MTAKSNLMEYLTSLGYLPKLEAALYFSIQKTADNSDEHSKAIYLIDQYRIEEAKGDNRH